MAFNFGNNQMFQGRGRSQGRQMQGMAQQGFGPRNFQPNPAAFRGQPFMQQQPQQGFQAGFGGYQVGQPRLSYPGTAAAGQDMAPYPGTSNVGQGMALYPGVSNAGQGIPNMQMQQQQFMMQQQQQQQKVMEQQRKQAEENKKKQEELRRRHNFEMQQRKLQSQKKGAASHLAVDNLFGKKEKGTTSTAMNLIGSLGMESSSKGATKHAPASSIFSRPGSSYQSGSPNSHAAPYGIEFMTHDNSGQAPTTLAAGGTDDFGDFAQGASIPGQDAVADEFSDFQEARSFGPGIQVPSSGMAPSALGAGQGPFSQSSWAVPSQPTNVSAANFPNSSSTCANTTQPSGVIATQNNPTSSNPMQSNSGSVNVGMTFLQKPRTDSFAGLSSPGLAMPGIFEMASSLGGLKSRSSSVSSQDSLGRVPSVSSSFNIPTSGSMVAHPSGFAPGESNTGNAMPVLSNDENVEHETEAEQTPAEKLQALYGTQLPDWCVNGTDLPSVYHDVTIRTTGGLDTIDTGELYHVLLSSGVTRDKLGLMWNQVNRANPGQLDVLELRMILGLVALAQAGIKAEKLTLQKLASCKAAPIPSFPEDVLEAKGRGWSFMEHQDEAENITASSDANVHNSNVAEDKDKYSAFSETGQAGPTGFLVSGSPSLVPTDPNDKYSVFRTVEVPGASNNQEDWGEMTEFQGAGKGLGSNVNEVGRTGVGDVGGIPLQLKQQQQQQQQKLSQPIKHRQEQPAESLKEKLQEDDDFGDFESVACAPPVSQSLSNSVTSSGDDFGNFQQNLAPSVPKGNLSEDLADNSSVLNLTKSQQVSTDLAKSLLGFTLKNSTTSSEDKSDTATVSSLFSLEPVAPVSSPAKPLGVDLTVKKDTTQKEAKDNVPGEPFGGFLSSGTSTTNLESGITKPSPAPTESASLKPSSDADDKYSAFRALDISSETSVFGSKSVEKPVVDDDFGDFEGPEFIREGPPPIEDDFGDFASPEFSSEVPPKNDFGNFASPKFNSEVPPKNDFGNFASPEFNSDVSPKNDFGNFSGPEFRSDVPPKEDFGNFSGPAFISEVPPPLDDDFGDFRSTDTPADKNVRPDSWQSNAAVFSAESSNNQPSTMMTSGEQTTNTEAAAKIENSKITFQADFGDFQTLGEVKPDNSSAFEMDSTPLSSTSQELPKGGSNGDFVSFGSFNAPSKSEKSADRPRSVSGSSQAFINSVPLELSQRYNLSKQFEDFDQHASAWCRCLNSCLLTLATASLAIQKMKEASLKQEILQSKEGSLYFASIVEVYRVTRRIRASVQKTAANNIKLKDILDEVESTWKNIASFLAGSETLPSQSSLDLSRLHVTSQDDRSVACGVCLLNVEKIIPGATKQADGKLKYGGRQYHTTCANFWCNRVDSVLPTLLPVYSLI